MSPKNFNETIGNRTRDLPACSAVPQPTAPQTACPRISCVRWEIFCPELVERHWRVLTGVNGENLASLLLCTYRITYGLAWNLRRAFKFKIRVSLTKFVTNEMEISHNACHYHCLMSSVVDRGSTVVKVLCYKSEGRWFDSRCRHCKFSLT